MAIMSSCNPSLNGNKNLPKGNEWQWTNRIEPIKNEFIDEIAIYQLICPIKKFTSKFQTHSHLFSITCFSLCTDKPSRYAFVIFWLCDIYSDFYCSCWGRVVLGIWWYCMLMIVFYWKFMSVNVESLFSKLLDVSSWLICQLFLKTTFGLRFSH